MGDGINIFSVDLSVAVSVARDAGNDLHNVGELLPS
jgi:hypothetical protein